MNTSTRVLLVSLLSVAVLAGCSSNKTKSASVAEVAPPADTTTPAYTGTAGAYGPEDLEKDACLRQRVIQFDFDQYTVKPEYQAVITATPSTCVTVRPRARPWKATPTSAAAASTTWAWASVAATRCIRPCRPPVPTPAS